MAEYICPHCKNPIFDDDALLCLYCGESLGRSKGFISSLKYSKPKVIAITVTILILLSFIILIMRS